MRHEYTLSDSADHTPCLGVFFLNAIGQVSAKVAMASRFFLGFVGSLSSPEQTQLWFHNQNVQDPDT
jgi:hypothetical protein